MRKLIDYIRKDNFEFKQMAIEGSWVWNPKREVGLDAGQEVGASL